MHGNALSFCLVLHLQAMWSLQSKQHYLDRLEAMLATSPELCTQLQAAVASLLAPEEIHRSTLRIPMAVPCRIGVCTELRITAYMPKSVSTPAAGKSAEFHPAHTRAWPGLCLQHVLTCSSRDHLALLLCALDDSMRAAAEAAGAIVTVFGMDGGVLLQNDASVAYMGERAVCSVAYPSATCACGHAGMPSASHATPSVLACLFAAHEGLLEEVLEQVAVDGAAWSGHVHVPAAMQLPHTPLPPPAPAATGPEPQAQRLPCASSLMCTKEGASLMPRSTGKHACTLDTLGRASSNTSPYTGAASQSSALQRAWVDTQHGGAPRDNNSTIPPQLDVSEARCSVAPSAGFADAHMALLHAMAREPADSRSPTRWQWPAGPGPAAPGLWPAGNGSVSGGGRSSVCVSPSPSARRRPARAPSSRALLLLKSQVRTCMGAGVCLLHATAGQRTTVSCQAMCVDGPERSTVCVQLHE